MTGGVSVLALQSDCCVRIGPSWDLSSSYEPVNGCDAAMTVLGAFPLFSEKLRMVTEKVHIEYRPEELSMMREYIPMVLAAGSPAHESVLRLVCVREGLGLLVFVP